MSTKGRGTMCRMMRRTKTLDIHMKEWGMEYHCHSCDKNFRSAKALDKHVNTKHNKKPKRGFKRREKK